MSRTPARELAMRIGLALCGFAFVLPYLLILTASFRPSRSVAESPLSPFGGGWSLANYTEVLQEGSVLRFYLNSVIVTTGIVALQIVTGVLAAFALGHVRVPGGRVVKVVVVAILSIPIPALVVPNYLTVDRLGLVDTRAGLILPFAASAFGIYLLTEYVESVPKGQLDSARLFGLSLGTRLRRVVLPHIRPAVLAFAGLSFVGYWNEFFWPLIVIQSPDLTTVPFSLQRYLTTSPAGIPEWGPMMAAGTLALLPLSLLLVLVQRSFVRTLAFARI